MSDWPYQLTMRPIEHWPRELTRNRKMSQFSATQRMTLKQLTKELQMIGAKNVVLQIAMEEQDFRNDGYPRAQARAQHPGVILSMEVKGSPISFPCDTYTTWLDNLRAVTLTMEHLRAVDRYGVTKNGEQYKGWREIEAPKTGFNNATEAWDYIKNVGGYERAETSSPRLIRDAKRKSHPDMPSGSASIFQRVNEAETYLREQGEI